MASIDTPEPVAGSEPVSAAIRREGSDAISLAETPCTEPAAELWSEWSESLTLREVDLDAVVEGPLSRTTLTFSIGTSDHAGQVEAWLRLRLPEAAVFRDLRLEVSGAWQPSGVVLRESAVRVYEEIVAKALDPALVEQEDPRTISVRVFPIVSGVASRVELTWVQPMVGSTRDLLTVPLCGLPAIDELHVRVEERGEEAPRVEEARLYEVTPRAPLQARLGGGRPSAIRDGRWVAAEVDPIGEPEAAPLSALTILVDTSASMAEGLDSQLGRLEAALALVARREPSLPVQILAFDQTVERIGSGRVDEAADLLGALRQRGALGGTDLVGGLEGALALGVHARLLVVTDGVPTLGLPEAAGVELVRRLRRAGVRRVDLLSSQPPWWLTEIVRRGPEAGLALGSDSSAVQLDRGLRRRPFNAERVLPGATLVSWGQGGGDETSLLLAHLRPGKAWAPKLDGMTTTSGPLPEATVEDLIAPLHGHAKLMDIEQERRWRGPDDPRHAKLTKQAAALALEHGLLSEHTALLALESKQSWVSWGLARFEPQYFKDIEEMMTLEPEARRLMEIERAQQKLERRYLLALEAWVRARQAGKDAGPRPERGDFRDESSAKARARLLERRHEVPASLPALAQIEEALAKGDRKAAQARLDAWRRATPDDPLIYLGGGRIAQVRGDLPAAARWFGSTFEGPAHDDAFESGLYFLSPGAAQTERLEDLRASQGSGDRLQSGIRRAIDALARGEAAAAIEILDDTPSGRQPQELDELRWLAASILTPPQRRRVAAALERHPAAPRSSPPRRLVVVMADEPMVGERLALVFETRKGALVASSNDPQVLLPGGGLGSLLVMPEPARSGRILLRAAGRKGDPLIGAAYVLERTTDGRVRVTHRPFVFDEVERTIDLD